MLTVDDLDQVIGGAGFVRGPRVAMHWVDGASAFGQKAPPGVVREAEDAHLVVTFRLVCYEADGQTVNNIKEQPCAFVYAAHRPHTDPARAAAYFAAWRDGLAEVFDQVSDDRIQSLMPHDLICADILTLKTAHTFDDFRPRMMTKGRLGGFLLPPNA